MSLIDILHCKHKVQHIIQCIVVTSTYFQSLISFIDFFNLFKLPLFLLLSSFIFEMVSFSEVVFFFLESSLHLRSHKFALELRNKFQNSTYGTALFLHCISSLLPYSFYLPGLSLLSPFPLTLLSNFIVVDVVVVALLVVTNLIIFS